MTDKLIQMTDIPYLNDRHSLSKTPIPLTWMTDSIYLNDR